MIDKSIRLYQAITDIDDAIIEEAQRKEMPQKKGKVFYKALIAAAAAACVILAGVLFYSGAIGGSKSGGAAAGGGAMAGGGAITGDSAIPAEGSLDSEERDYSPIAYKNLALPEIDEIPGGENLSYGSVSLDIAAFDERFLQEQSCCGILEGRILQIYPKEYAVDFYDDKFGEVQLFHGKAFSMVYELEIEKVWYGENFAAGERVLVEDEYFQLDPLASLQTGRTYVIPIYEAGEEIAEAKYSVHELAPGDFARDSIYSTIYAYHPQITKTEDGNYLLTNDWQTLAAYPCREVVIDKDPLNTGVDAFEPFYQDRFRLVYGDDFAERLSALIEEQLGKER